jgi:hypothetical protein
MWKRNLMKIQKIRKKTKIIGTNEIVVSKDLSKFDELANYENIHKPLLHNFKITRLYITWVCYVKTKLYRFDDST